ncbi:hypothetical protein EAE99_011521 [Botrytis elliptica]|nr:hypothetical protein EAE99_011521 [Botrytis elliptica]
MESENWSRPCLSKKRSCIGRETDDIGEAGFHWSKAQYKDDGLLSLFGASILFVAFIMLKSLRPFEYQMLSNLHYSPDLRELKEVYVEGLGKPNPFLRAPEKMMLTSYHVITSHEFAYKG